jgi:mono/diheme cytochrome c family protein
MNRKLLILLIVLLAAAAVTLLTYRLVIRTYWTHRSDNPVRHGVALAGKFGCYYCHGSLGDGGIPDPGLDGRQVPAWSSDMFLVYSDRSREIKEIIRDGDSHEHSGSHVVKEERLTAAISMPAFGELVDEAELDALVAAVTAISGMNLQPSDSLAVSGYAIVKQWGCESCHGPAGSGGFPNPTSVAGFIPGWYGADFRELVRDREEFDEWIREGITDRFETNAMSSYLIHHQTIRMPRYEHVSERELDALWAYVKWLDETSGGVAPAPAN